MEIGIDSFASAMGNDGKIMPSDVSLQRLLDRIEHADKNGLDFFGIGEHHREEFLDSATVVILAAAAARTSRIDFRNGFEVLGPCILLSVLWTIKGAG